MNTEKKIIEEITNIRDNIIEEYSKRLIIEVGKSIIR